MVVSVVVGFRNISISKGGVFLMIARSWKLTLLFCSGVGRIRGFFYVVGVLCDSIEVDLGCIVDYEDVVYVSCLEDDMFCV